MVPNTYHCQSVEVCNIHQKRWHWVTLKRPHKLLDVHIECHRWHQQHLGETFVTIMCPNDELSSTMSWVGCLLKDSELFILFAENSQILLKISVIPILLTFIYLVALNLLVNNQLNSSLWHIIVTFIVCVEVSRDKFNISVLAPKLVFVVPVAYKIFPCLISNVDIKTVLFGPL